MLPKIQYSPKNPFKIPVHVMMTLTYELRTKKIQQSVCFNKTKNSIEII